jgi:transcriptional regulator with XRE-family HTH domain
MQLNEKVQFYRMQRGYSQEYISELLGLEQSQYSRRETGQVDFRAQEIARLSEVLGVEIAELFNDSTIVFTSNNQSGGNFGQYVTLPDKLIEQYEARLREKDEMIAVLKAQITHKTR